MSNEKEYKEFRDLLRKGIGTRTQSEFAEQTGISRGYLNRMLNAPQITRPSVSTLESIASGMMTISLNELLASCGYDEMSDRDRAEAFERDIAKAFEDLFNESGRVWASVSDMVDTLRMLYLKKGTFTKQSVDESCPKELLPYADRRSKLCLTWKDGTNNFLTYFNVYYSILASEKIVILYTSFSASFAGDEDDIEKRTSTPYKKLTKYTVMVKQEEVAAAKLLMQRIFGPRYEMTTIVGYGFSLTEMPKGFVRFVQAHAGSFCTTRENVRLFNELIKPDADVEEILASYVSRDGSKGPYAALEDILNIEFGDACREVFGDDFHYYEKDYDCDKDANECIMIPAAENTEREIPGNILAYLYQCARELEIPCFGMCYYHKAIPRTEKQEYNTKNYYLL